MIPKNGRCTIGTAVPFSPLAAVAVDLARPIRLPAEPASRNLISASCSADARPKDMPTFSASLRADEDKVVVAVRRNAEPICNTNWRSPSGPPSPAAKSALHVRRPDGRTESITVKIPAGIEDGKKIRLREQGDADPAGGPNGDLLITVHVAPHPCYQRRGNDLIVTVPVTLAEAAAGAKVDVPTPKGVITLTVPPGSSSGRRLRAKGLGIAPAKGPTGDLFAELRIMIPKQIDDAALEQIRELDQKYPLQPRTELQW